MKKNLICVPCGRSMRRYTGSPFPMISVLTISSEVVCDVISALSKLGLHSKGPAVTFDKIHTSAHCAVVIDWPSDSSNEVVKLAYLVGGLTKADLSGARLALSDLAQGCEKLEEATLATGFVTIMLHDTGGLLVNGLLAAAIPVAAENAELLFALLMRLRAEVFKAGIS